MKLEYYNLTIITFVYTNTNLIKLRLKLLRRLYFYLYTTLFNLDLRLIFFSVYIIGEVLAILLL